MKFNEKLQVLRRNKGMSQEALAEEFGVTRQAVSRWENGQVYPETEKIVAMSDFFGISLDDLVKDGRWEPEQEINVDRVEARNDFNRWHRRGYEYKSEKVLWGMPLLHVSVGFGAKRASGVIAIGNVANGIISLGLVSAGVISLGFLSLGVFGFGTLAFGLLLAFGAISIGAVAFGAIALGLVSFGAVAIGMYAQGALAVASRVAIGDHAYGYIAVGQTVANGTREFLSSTGSFSDISRDEVRLAINDAFPNTWSWIVNFITMFLGG